MRIGARHQFFAAPIHIGPDQLRQFLQVSVARERRGMKFQVEPSCLILTLVDRERASDYARGAARIPGLCGRHGAVRPGFVPRVSDSEWPPSALRPVRAQQ
jgi:hypothetical protein